MAYDFFGLQARAHHQATLAWQTEMTHRLLAIERQLKFVLEKLDEMDSKESDECQ